MNTLPQTKYKILLLGDSCTDEYQYGVVERISPEAPIPIFDYLYSEFKPGMASNVKANLLALGCEVDFLTLGESRKIRLIDIKTRQQLVRIDHDNCSKESISFDTLTEDYDAIVIADYNKGAISSETVNSIRQCFDGPVYVDTKKKTLSMFEGFFVKINEKERNECTSTASNMIVTLGSKGSIYNDVRIEGIPVELADVCGAGDTYLASLTYFHLLTGNMFTAMEYANKASAITVQHFGTYAPTLEEIQCV